MKAALKHLIAFAVILVTAVTVATASGELYRVTNYPTEPKHEVLDFNIGLIFLIAFLFTTGLLSLFWISIQRRRKYGDLLVHAIKRGCGLLSCCHSGSNLPLAKRCPARNSVDVKQLPLTDAYPFAAKHGLDKEAESIRRGRAGWKSYTSSVRRGFIIELFTKHKIFDAFKTAHWNYGNTESGIITTRRYLNIKEQFLKSQGRNV